MIAVAPVVASRTASPLRRKMLVEMRVRHLLPRTEEAYVRVIEQLYLYYRRMPDELDCDEVVGFLEHCVSVRKLSRSTVNVYFQACRFLYEQVLKRDRLSFNLPRRSRPKTRPQVLSPEECRRVIEAPKGVKYRALLHMVYGSGLRVSEVVRLKLGHIESGRMMVFVEGGKGAKDRYTVLSERALEELRAYWRRHRPALWLFPGRDEDRPLSEASAQRAYYNALRRGGVRRVGGIHTLRHCFATHLTEQSVDLHIIQRWMGHTVLNTTARYLHVREECLSRVVSPLDFPA